MSVPTQSMTDILANEAREKERKRIANLRGMSIVGAGMGLRPTTGIAELLSDQAGREEKVGFEERATQAEQQIRAGERAEQQQYRRQQQENWQRNFDEDRRQFGEQEARLKAKTTELDPYKIGRGEDALRDDYRTEMTNITGSLSAVEKVEAFLPHNLGRMPNPAEQQGMVIGLNKMTDPTSVVRESEYARTQEGQGLLSRAENYAEMIRSGRFLSKEMLDDIGQMTTIYKQLAEKRAQDTTGEYNDIATRRGYDPANVIKQRYLPKRKDDEPPEGSVKEVR